MPALPNCYSKNDNGIADVFKRKQEIPQWNPNQQIQNLKDGSKPFTRNSVTPNRMQQSTSRNQRRKWKIPFNPEISALTAQIETLKAANVAISAEHEALKAATIKAQRDSEWTALKNTLPPAWVDAEHEAETRNLAETSPLGFALKLTAFNTKKIGNVKSAEGSCACSAF